VLLQYPSLYTTRSQYKIDSHMSKPVYVSTQFRFVVRPFIYLDI